MEVCAMETLHFFLYVCLIELAVRVSAYVCTLRGAMPELPVELKL